MPGTLQSQERKLSSLSKINILFKNIHIFFKKEHMPTLVFSHCFFSLPGHPHFFLVMYSWAKEPTWKLHHMGSLQRTYAGSLDFFAKCLFVFPGGRISSTQLCTALFPSCRHVGENSGEQCGFPSFGKHYSSLQDPHHSMTFSPKPSGAVKAHTGSSQGQRWLK